MRIIDAETPQRRGRERIRFRGLKAVVVGVKGSEVPASKETTGEALTEEGPAESAVEGFGGGKESCRCGRRGGQCGLH